MGWRTLRWPNSACSPNTYIQINLFHRLAILPTLWILNRTSNYPNCLIMSAHNTSAPSVKSSTTWGTRSTNSTSKCGSRSRTSSDSRWTSSSWIRIWASWRMSSSKSRPTRRSSRPNSTRRNSKARRRSKMRSRTRWHRTSCPLKLMRSATRATSPGNAWTRVQGAWSRVRCQCRASSSTWANSTHQTNLASCRTTAAPPSYQTHWRSLTAPVYNARASTSHPITK